eukprot:gene57478-biopygen70072
MDNKITFPAGVSVGKLGVALRLQLEVVKDFCIKATVARQSEPELLDIFAALKTPAGYKRVHDFEANKTARNFLWLPALRRMSYSDGEQTALENCNPEEADPFDEFDPAIDFLRTYLQADKAAGLAFNAWTRYEQIEYAVPFGKAHECFDALFNEILKTDDARSVLEGPVLIRFVGQHNHYLSWTAQEPRVTINMDIHVDYRHHSADECGIFDSIVEHFGNPDGKCGGALHWGKGGWEQMDYNSTKKQYPLFDQFVEVMKEWDPTAKFRGYSPVFDATGNATQVPNGQCRSKLFFHRDECASPSLQQSRCKCTAKETFFGQQMCDWVGLPNAPIDDIGGSDGLSAHRRGDAAAAHARSTDAGIVPAPVVSAACAALGLRS